MSRSRRKTPKAGITTIESDKWFKSKEHRKERAVVRQKLAHGDEPIVEKSQFGGANQSGKDGKHYQPGDPAILRK